MRQTVTIQENKDGKLVAGCDKSACEGCKGSFFCTSKNSTFTVDNPSGIVLSKGDKAVIELPPRKTLFSVFMSLGFPLLMFLPGYFIASIFTDSQGYLFLASIAGVAVGFIISAIYFRARKVKYTPVVIDKGENED